MSKAGGRSFSSIILALGMAGLFSAASAFGAAVVEESKGEVRAGPTPAQSERLTVNQRVLPGTMVSTARGSRVVLRFDDGQAIALYENTRFRIDEFRYRPQDPAADRAAFVLLEGALRALTGVLGGRSPDAFSLVVPQSTIGIRGTDFMVALVNSAYLSVLKGTIAATNAAGTATFGTGTLGSVASPTTLAVSIPASALPAAAASAFGSLGALSLAAGSSGGEIKLPGTTSSKAQDASAFGRETAGMARNMKEDLSRDLGRDASEAARDRARDRIPNPRKP